MKSPAKLNIFLKIVGTRGDYHEILSRFVRFEGLFDEIDFVLRSDKGEILQCNANIENNIVLKAKDALCQAGFGGEVERFFKEHQISLTKRIPMGAGLGGGSSNAATFLLLANEHLGLKILLSDLMSIGAKVGSDVPFFISGAVSANVSGVGEIIEKFNDEPLDIEIFTPEIFCSTPEVYRTFRANFMQNIDVKKAQKFLTLSSKELLENFANYELNDLYAPCTKLYPKLADLSENKFLSGSGSSLFWVKGNR